jgi:hypothetical protein
MFEANEENTYKIDLSLNRDTTVMFLASKVGGKDLLKSTFHLRKNIHVVSAASYRCVCPDEADDDFKTTGSRSPATAPKSVSLDDADKETKETDVMLTWLAVSDRTHPMPSIAASWRRQGIGQFMFILIIKQCAAFQDGVNIEDIAKVVSFNIYNKYDGTLPVIDEADLLERLNLSYELDLSKIAQKKELKMQNI